MSNAPANNRVDQRKQAVTGLVPPHLGEAVIRDVWPTLLASTGPTVAHGIRWLSDTIVLRPLAWFLLLGFFLKRILPPLPGSEPRGLIWLLLLPVMLGKKLLPGTSARYTLTNRRLMVKRSGRQTPFHEIALADIQDVRTVHGSYDPYFRAATLEVVSKGAVAFTLPGVREPESFRLAILNACQAWAPTKPKGVMPPEKQAAVQGAR